MGSYLLDMPARPGARNVVNLHGDTRVLRQDRGTGTHPLQLCMDFGRFIAIAIAYRPFLVRFVIMLVPGERVKTPCGGEFGFWPNGQQEKDYVLRVAPARGRPKGITASARACSAARLLWYCT